MIHLKQLITEVKYDFGSVMAQLPPSVASPLVEFGKRIIPDDMLYFSVEDPDDYGREKDPHVTIKFGLVDSYPPNQIAEMLKGTKPFQITITGMDIFQNPEFDVIKLNIEGDELFRLRKIFDRLPNNDEHPIYHPHMTLAYVQPGLGKRFKGIKTKSISGVPITIIKYSDRGAISFFNL